MSEPESGPWVPPGQPAPEPTTLEQEWAAQMRFQLAKYGLQPDVSVAGLIAVAKGAIPPAESVLGQPWREVQP